MLWQLASLALCVVLLVPTLRGLLAVRSLQRRPQSFVLARAFHRPIYGTCVLLLVLRVAFFAVIATNNLEKMDLLLKMATFALLDLPSVAITALNSYIVLFAVRLVFRRRWPGASSDRNGMMAAVFVAFCTSLVALVVLVAMCRAEGDKWSVAVPQWMTFGYSAVIWITLGLLMLKYQGQALQILWRNRRRNQWREERSKKPRHTLPVLTISSLQNLAVCSTLLAELLIVRGIVSAVVASQNDNDEMVEVDSWRNVILHYFSWEVACVAIVLRMLHRTPIAVHCFTGGPNSADKSALYRSEIPSAPTIDEGEIQIDFQVPNIRELITDYVVPSNASLIGAGLRRMDEAYENRPLEHRFCRIHDNGVPVGAEYVGCHCYRERGGDPFSSSATVPLLANECEPACDVRSSSSISSQHGN